MKLTELELEHAVRLALEAEGWTVCGQWKLGSKRVDLVASRDDEVNSFEVKTKDWRRASHQAYLNIPYFDRSYVVLPSNPRRRVPDGWFEELGLGLVELSERSELTVVVVPPRLAVAEAIAEQRRLVLTGEA